MNLRRRLLTLLLSFALSTPAAAVEFEPPSGLGMTITGGIMAGVGLMNLATMPLCRADFYVESVGTEGSNVCMVAAGVYAGVGLGVGVPMFVAGKKRRAAYKAWRERHEPTVGVAPQPGGAAVAWSARF